MFNIEYIKVFIESMRKLADSGREASKEHEHKSQKDMHHLCKEFSFKENQLKTSTGISFKTVTVKPLQMTDNEEINSIHVITIYPKTPWQAYLKEVSSICKISNVVSIGLNENIFNFDVSVNKGISQVDKLLKSGVKPENIIIRGMCFAGACATYIVKHFYDKGITLNLFSDRSFAKTLRLSQRMLEYTGSNKIAINTLGYIFRPIENLVIRHKKLETNPGEKFLEMFLKNPDRINYTVYRTSQKEDDELVNYHNSIHMVLKPYRVSLKKPLKDSISLIEGFETNLGQESLDISILINQLKINKTAYEKIVEETDGKKINLGLFDKAINALSKKRDTFYAKACLAEAVSRINLRHKLEKIYKHDNRLGHDASGRWLYNRGSHVLLVPNYTFDKNKINPRIISNNKIREFNFSEINPKESMFGHYINKIQQKNTGKTGLSFMT